MLLIDDVTTTGSTLSALAGILLDAGAIEVAAAVFAKVPSIADKSEKRIVYRKIQ